MNRDSYQNTLVMMVRRPLCGAVKSRLAAGIGAVAATSAYRTMIRNSIHRLADDPRWCFVLAIAPDSALFEPFWPLSIALIAQGRGGLGDRMQHIMTRMPPGNVVIIGSDIAAMKPVHVASAFNKLGCVDAVFSPAGDGGYSLVGLKRVPRVPDIFSAVRWSSAHTLDDTLRNLAGLTVGYIETLADIDTVTDWDAWQSQGRAGRLCL